MKTKKKIKGLGSDFTVLLMLPDYVASNYGEETYLAHVRGATVRDATRKAQFEAAKSVRGEIQDDPADYLPLAVFKGKLTDLRT